MASPDTGISYTAGQAQRQARTGFETGLFQCLILSADPARREMLAQAAADSGWNVVTSGAADHALECLNRMLLQLGVVDLAGSPPKDFQPLLEKIAPMAGLLLVVCGNEGNVREEIWVRQLGAWLYLTSVEDAGCISLLCHEAREITERLRGLDRLNGRRDQQPDKPFGRHSK